MDLKGMKIEFDLEEFVPLLLKNKQEGFWLIGERFLNALMEKEFEAFIGSGKHERSKERVDYRNGYKERQLKTTLGELNLLRPYARSGRFETKLFENYSRIDKALASMIVESYLKGVSTRDEESYAAYKGFFDTLKERGIEKVDLVISDGHKGIKRAAASSFAGSSGQLCTVHFKRNLMKIVPKKVLREVLGYLDEIFKAKDVPEAIGIGHVITERFGEKYPKLSRFLIDNLDDVITFLAFPKRHHRKIHSTNVLERFNKEVKRRTKVVGAFPSEGSALCLLVPLAVDTNAKWLDRKYVSWKNMEHDSDVEEEFTENF